MILPRFAAALACAVAACLAAAAPSPADSIVYLKDGNVWLTSADGSKGYQVTSDGGWDSPSQADDGTIVAAKGQTFVRMDRSGRQLSAIPAVGGASSPVPGETFKLFGPFDPEVSPDGRRIAYWATAYDPTTIGDTIGTNYRDVTLVTPSDRFEMPRENWVTSVKEPSWANDERLLVSGSGLGNYNFETWLAGGGDEQSTLQWWFHYVNAMESDSELSRDGRKLVSVAQTNGATSVPNTLHFFAVPGPAWTAPPYTNTWQDGAVRPPAGEPRCENVRDSEVHNPSWNPSGSAIAYEDRDGIYVQRVDLDNCPGMGETLLVPGGRHADWGPADVDLSQAPGAAGPVPVTAAPGGAATLTVKVARRASRRKALRVRITLTAPARVALSLCKGSRCVRRKVQAAAGTTTVRLKLRGLRAGRHRLTVSPAGGAAVKRIVKLR